MRHTKGNPVYLKVEQAYVPGQQFTFHVGDAVICNNYAGTITHVCDGQLDGMVEIKMAGGFVCVSACYPDCYPA